MPAAVGSFVFIRNDQGPGQMVFCDSAFMAPYIDSANGRIFLAAGGAGHVFEWDNLTQPPQTQEWKSKVIVTKDYINLGAARIVADYPDNITFKFWVDKQLLFTTVITDKEIFRLPTGYRADTFEFSVEGKARIRAVHLAETPLGLKEA